MGMIVIAERLARKTYQYVVSAQILGEMKEKAIKYFGDSIDGSTNMLLPENKDIPALKMKKDLKDVHSFFMIRELMRRYPGLQVAYVDKKWNKAIKKWDQHCSVLTTLGGEIRVERWCERCTHLNEIHRVPLPGHFMVGEAKPSNQ